MLTAYKPENRSLQTYQGGRFIEKIFTDQAGQQFKVVFFVTLVNGELKGSIVSASPLPKNSFATQDVVCLPISIPKNIPVTEYIPAYVPVVSPFTELFFFTSQPTRAPNR